MTDPATITVDGLRARLRRAQAEIGSEGRFSVTFYQQPDGAAGCSVMRWTRTGTSGLERCEEVGHGTLAECLAALERYVAAHRQSPDAAAVAPSDAGDAPATTGR